MRTDTARRLLAGASTALLSLTLAGPASAAVGELDPLFGTGGATFVDFDAAGEDNAFAVALDPQGRTVVAGGNRTTGSFQFQLARLGTDGALDGGFGTGGRVTTPMGDAGGTVRALATLADGSVIAAGDASDDANPEPYFALAKYTPAGELDAAFGPEETPGRVLTEIGPWTSEMGGDTKVADIAVLPGGDILVAGTAHYNDFLTRMVVARYEADGRLDTGFGIGGVATVQAPEYGYSIEAGALAVQSDGKIVVGGTDFHGAGEDFALVRLEADGDVDDTFGGGSGYVLTRMTPAAFTEYYRDRLTDLAIDDAGRIVAVGVSDHADHEDAIARYGSDGDLDTDFGTGGRVRVERDGYSEARTVATLPGGAVLTGGYSGGGDSSAVLARFTATGAPDATFGTGGATTFAPGTGAHEIEALAVSADGTRAVAAGSDSAAFLVTRATLAAADGPLVEDDEPQQQPPVQQEQQPPARQPAPPVVTTPVPAAPRVTPTPRAATQRSRRCTSRRQFTITPRHLGLRRVRVAALGRAGRRAAVRVRAGKVAVDLRRLPAGTYRVRLTGRTKSGAARTVTKTYRTCG